MSLRDKQSRWHDLRLRATFRGGNFTHSLIPSLSRQSGSSTLNSEGGMHCNVNVLVAELRACIGCIVYESLTSLSAPRARAYDELALRFKYPIYCRSLKAVSYLPLVGKECSLHSASKYNSVDRMPGRRVEFPIQHECAYGPALSRPAYDHLRFQALGDNNHGFPIATAR